MLPNLLLAISLVSGLQAAADIPIRVGNTAFDPMDLSVTYEFVNDAADVTAYEVSITRYLADGSTLVSTQGQDWFSSTGYSAVRAVAYSQYESWLPGYPTAKPGTHLHLLRPRPRSTAALIDADVKITAVIRLDGSAIGSRKVLDRLFAQRRLMLSEYAFWMPFLERARSLDDPLEGLNWAAHALAKPRSGEVLSEPRECLRSAAEQMHRWSQDHPNDASRVLGAIINLAAQQQQLLTEQSVWKR
jgi:hypothetical protein